LVLSRIWGERWTIPSDRVTLTALAYLVLLGSVVLFIIYVWTIKRWTASGMSYMFVLMPIVASVVGAWLADEPVSAPVVIGGLIILAGVYFGALSGKQKSIVEAAGESVVEPSCGPSKQEVGR
jgi:drug/metabolite transporter (DMT)-like permease